MTHEEAMAQIKEMRRYSNDQARAERAITADFIDEYREGISGHPNASRETHKRSIEIYDFAIRAGYRERQHLSDVEVFDAIILALEAASGV